MTWAEAAHMQDIWITHSWAGRTRRSLTIPLFISTLVSWRLRPIHDGRVFCCFSEQRRAEGGREESSCYIEEPAHVISSLLTPRKDPLVIRHSKRHAELSVFITEGQDLISYVGKAGGGNFYPLSCFLITLFSNNSQSGKTLDFKDSIFLFPVCFELSLATCDKGGMYKGWLEWVDVGWMLVSFRACLLVKWYSHIVGSDKTGYGPGTCQGPRRIPRALFGCYGLAIRGIQLCHSCMN